MKKLYFYFINVALIVFFASAFSSKAYSQARTFQMYGANNWHFQFQVSTLEAQEDSYILFNNISYGYRYTTEWIFEGATQATSTQKFLRVDYPDPGVYDVTLINHTTTGSDTLYLENFITITARPIVYCYTRAGISRYEYIDMVAVGDLVFPSGNDGGLGNWLPLPGTNNGAGNYLRRPANLVLGETQRIYVSAGFPYRPYTEFFVAWIDWDKDGNFEDSEIVINGSVNDEWIHHQDFEIPSFVTPGETRMRVTMRWRQAATPCRPYVYGEVEEFAINILPEGSVSGKLALESSEIGDVDEISLAVYPSPASEHVEIEILNSEINDRVNVYDINGRLVKSKHVEGSKFTFNVQDLAEGVYRVVVEDERRSLQTSFVKL